MPTKSRPPLKTPAALLEAETLIQQGAVAEGKKKILEELALRPSVEGYNLLGIVYSGEKDFANALAAFQNAIKLDSNSIKTHNNLGNLYVAEGKTGLGEHEFRWVLHRDPQNNDASYNLGVVLLARGLAAEAIPHFQTVRPATTATRLQLTQAYLSAGRKAEGLKLARELSAVNKNDVQIHFTLGVMLASEQQYSAAQLELEKANTLQPETFDILFHLGQAYLKAREYAKAEPQLDRALKLKPDSPQALHLLAQVYLGEARSADALHFLVRAHKLAPDDTDIIFLMARTSMSQNYFEDAIPVLESGVKLAPQRADLRAALGESYFTSGKTAKALVEFQKLIELDSSARSYAAMGVAYRQLGRFDEAKKYLDQGLKRDPHNAICLFNLGYIDEAQGNYSKAEGLFQQALQANPDFPDALLEMANLRIANKQFMPALELLRKYVRVSRDPASGYYKLAMVERSLHQTEAAQRDLNVFQTLSKDAVAGPYPYQHLFDYLDNRSGLAPQNRILTDVEELTQQIREHPGQPQDLYLLAEAYLKLGKPDEAHTAIAQLDQTSANDFRVQTGVGVLLARFHLYEEAIQHFQIALRANPTSDDIRFDLVEAYFRKGLYAEALDAARQVSAAGQQDDTFLSLLGDIHAHLGDTARAAEIFRDAISRNPDQDQYYLSLTLVQLRQNDVSGAEETGNRGLARMPNSGKILWGLGIVSVMEGKTAQAADQFERAVDLLPGWPGGFSILGAFYFQTGQIEKAREVLNRFKGSNAGGSLDVRRIEDALSRAPAASFPTGGAMRMGARKQLLQLALSLADRTL